MEQKVGNISAVSFKEHKFGVYSNFLIDEDWFCIKGDDKAAFKKGDKIAFTYKTEEVGGRTYRYVQDYKVEAGAEPAKKEYKKKGGGGGWNNKADPEVQASIIRQNALTNATTAIVGTGVQGLDTETLAERIITLASRLNEYTSTGKLPEFTTKNKTDDTPPFDSNVVNLTGETHGGVPVVKSEPPKEVSESVLDLEALLGQG